jgi:membrane peptidoglycan carboxypeptidase
LFRRKKLFLFFVTPLLIISLLLIGSLFLLFLRTPIPELNPYVGTQATVVTYESGAEIGRFASENRIELDLIRIPMHLRNAVMAAEDKGFYSQPAFSVKGILRAAINNLTGGELQGGSTITQQYAKIAYLTPERTISRKIEELFVAIRIEQNFSKSEILESYLNTVYFGRGAYGVETASNQYFDKSVFELTLSEAIFLASLIRSPGLYDLYLSVENERRARDRFDFIALGMLDQGWISNQAFEGLKFPLVLPRSQIQSFSGTKGHLLEHVRTELSQLGFTEDQIQKGGLRVATTLNSQYQSAAERVVRIGRPKDSPDDLHVGLVAIEPGTGRILAMYGGEDYLKRQLNNATQAITQAGSTFKIFGLAAALERGIPLSSIWDGRSPQVFYGAGQPYRVSNYGNTQFQKISLLRATANSVNTIFVRIAYRTGFSLPVEIARRSGIPSSVEMLPTPSFVLGVSSPRVIDVASAFATFAADGINARPYIVQSVTDSDSKVIYEAKAIRQRAISKSVAADVTYALRSVVQSGTATGALYDLGRPAAGKTGTSQNNASAWFTGYTPDLAASVALFRDDATESLNGIGGLTSVTGGSIPARIWKLFVKEALRDKPIRYFGSPAFIGGTKPIDLINPSPSASPSRTRDSKQTPEDKKPKLPKLPGVTSKPIPLPSVTTKKIP